MGRQLRAQTSTVIASTFTNRFTLDGCLSACVSVRCCLGGLCGRAGGVLAYWRADLGRFALRVLAYRAPDVRSCLNAIHACQSNLSVTHRPWMT